MKKTSILFLFLIHLVNISSLEQFVDLDLINRVTPVRYLENGVLFTLNRNIGRRIFIRTDLDNWENDHYFRESLYGVLYLLIPYKQGKSSIKYRINVDGFWIEDPMNHNSSEDNFGILINSINIPSENIYYSRMPLIEQTNNRTRKVTFKYYNPSAREVNFVSSLDNWNTFSNTMERDPNRAGYWTIDLYFRQGSYMYFFLADGRKFIDISNPDNTFISRYDEVSVLNIR